MTCEITEAERGFALVRLEPVVVAVFPSRAAAERERARLAADDAEAAALRARARRERRA